MNLFDFFSFKNSSLLSTIQAFVNGSANQSGDSLTSFKGSLSNKSSVHFDTPIANISALHWIVHGTWDRV